jgi:hypothetical protein
MGFFTPPKRAPGGEITKRDTSKEGMFGKKPHITRRRFRQLLKTAPRRIPEASKFSTQERIAMEEGMFPKKEYGAYISPYEVNKKVRKLKKELYRSRDAAKKIEIRKQIDFLKKLKGSEKTL